MSTSPSNEVEANRQPDHEINPQFIERWSPRSFSDQDVPEDVLLCLLEAARWAPSGNNNQPWRFIIARTPEHLTAFHSFIHPSNRVWCEKAPVLALAISHTLTPRGTENASHAFDTGTAWGYLALEANNQGLITHAMGGFDRDLARQTLNIPNDYAIHAVIAIGYRGPVDALPENLREREVPSSRNEVSTFTYFGKFE
ncbi:nitroreductase family protein [Paenibacillus roseipurpureus]|uniref:Nitroreductase family protein n=1 Tax=Paenibacillus roseopurpureus TaxID=2918901 RepID=A0AA96LJY9_9BACL|nr:nitroreductase family protein [Paenibacillus sp. MBLB1832]WNR42269.1 nitroreductase family protein [Paenibacillus sp. MBLB1832]